MKGSTSIVVGILCIVVMGCQSDSNLPVDQEKALRGKINEGLSPAEIEKYFGKDGLKGKGAPGTPAAPAKSAGG